MVGTETLLCWHWSCTSRMQVKKRKMVPGEGGAAPAEHGAPVSARRLRRRERQRRRKRQRVRHDRVQGGEGENEDAEDSSYATRSESDDSPTDDDAGGSSDEEKAAAAELAAEWATKAEAQPWVISGKFKELKCRNSTACRNVCKPVNQPLRECRWLRGCSQCCSRPGLAGAVRLRAPGELGALPRGAHSGRIRPCRGRRRERF
jgi:hypothetical protein